MSQNKSRLVAESPALPGLAAGALGLVAGMIGSATNSPSLGLVAGVLALAAGVAGVRVAQQLDEQDEMRIIIEQELSAVRAEARETEAKLREELATSNVIFPFLDQEVGEPSADPLIDEQTGLFSESFFLVSLDSRVAAARRHLRPVAVILLQVVQGLPAGEPIEANPVSVANAITETLREADTACYRHNGEFALLLEDTPENGAIWTVERIRRALASVDPKTTMWAGVACYPAHAFSSLDLLSATEQALDAAREWRQDRIEVALAASD